MSANESSPLPSPSSLDSATWLGRAHELNSSPKYYSPSHHAPSQGDREDGCSNGIRDSLSLSLQPPSPRMAPESRMQGGSTKESESDRSATVPRSRYAAWNRNALNLSLSSDSDRPRSAKLTQGHSLSLDELQYHRALSRYTVSASSVAVINSSGGFHVPECPPDWLAGLKSTSSVGRHSTSSEASTIEKPRRGAYWMTSVKEWLRLREPSMQGMRQYKKTLWTRHGLKPGDPRSAARMGIPYGDIPTQVNPPASGPLFEELSKRKKRRDQTESTTRPGSCCSPESSGLPSPSSQWTCKEKLATPWECEQEEAKHAARSSEAQSMQCK